MATDERRRVQVDRGDFLEYAVGCPFCGTKVGPRFVTRELAEVPPLPPYGAAVRCPTCHEIFEVLFRDAA